MNPNQEPELQKAVTQLADRWQWFHYAMFGGIGALSLRQLESGLYHAWTTSWSAFVLHLAITACLFAFFVYVVGVVDVLTRKFPYRLSVSSALRYGLDIAMAFLLLQLLLTGLGPKEPIAVGRLNAAPVQSPLLMTTVVSLWHLGAACWHVLAVREGGSAASFRANILPHVGFAGIYWLVFFTWCGITGFWFGKVDYDSPYLLSMVSFTIFCIAVIRWKQIVRHHLPCDLVCPVPVENKGGA